MIEIRSIDPNFCEDRRHKQRESACLSSPAVEVRSHDSGFRCRFVSSTDPGVISSLPASPSYHNSRLPRFQKGAPGEPKAGSTNHPPEVKRRRRRSGSDSGLCRGCHIGESAPQVSAIGYRFLPQCRNSMVQLDCAWNRRSLFFEERLNERETRTQRRCKRACEAQRDLRSTNDDSSKRSDLATWRSPSPFQGSLILC